MLDIHFHILPGMDDGPDTWEESLALAEAARAAGTTGVFATPHYMTGVHEPGVSQVRDAVGELKERLQAESVAGGATTPVEVYPGMETYLSPELPGLWERGRLLPLGGEGPYLLVEMGFRDFPSWAPEVLFELQVRGAVPVLAHPERNLVLQSAPARLADLVKRGFLIQLNAGSLTGVYGPGARRLAQQLILAGVATFVGSDAHSVGGRPPDLNPALALVRQWGGEQAATDLVATNPRAVLAGKTVEQKSAPVQLKQPAGWWQRLLGRGG